MAVLTLGNRQVSYEIAGSGPVIVWVAGTGQSGALWRRYQVPYFESRFTNLTPDLSGIGDSSPPPTPCTPASLASDIVALVRGLDVGSATFIGLGLGSAVVQEIALAVPDLVRSAVLIGTWSCTRSQRHLWNWFAGRQLAYRVGDASVTSSQAFWTSSATLADTAPELMDELAHFRQDMARDRSLSSLMSHYEADLAHDTHSRLSEIQCPVLVLYGEEDFITLPRYNRDVASRIPGAKAIIIREAGHLAVLEHSARVNDAILAFLSA